jgi:CTP synthase (UTP-ammonia lyase)
VNRGAPTLALIGERDLGKKAHAGIEASLALYARSSARPLQWTWVRTDDVGLAARLEAVGGVWCVPGSPYADTAGALRAIRFAREAGRPFFGTCGGFQHALIEYCANVLGLPAVHEELDATTPDPLIARLSCSLVGATAAIVAPEGGWYASVVGGSRSDEEFHCNYGLAPRFAPLFDATPLRFVAWDEERQPRAFRLEGHPFFVGTLFQPERRALRGELHPLVRAFFDAMLFA